MRSSYLFIISLLFFLQCGSDSDYLQEDISEKIEPYKGEFLSLEIAFGSEKYGTKDEFLLVDPLPSPFQLLVNNNGDILLVDESRIKIYEKNGIGKKILGRPGYGPGEFEDSPDIFLGPTGYLLALTSPKSTFTFYNLYDPDYNFIEKIRIQNNQRILDYVQSKVPDIKSYYVDQIIPLNKKEKLYKIEYMNIQEQKKMISVFYENNDGIIEFLNVKKPDSFSTEKYSTNTSDFGSFFLDILSGRRIVYINTDDDRHDEKTGSFYIIHIISLDTREDKQIACKFNSIEYTEDYIEDFYRSAMKPSKVKGEVMSEREKHHKALGQFLRKKKFYPSIRRMKIDGQYAIFELLESQFKNKEYILDIIDLEAGKFIKRIMSPTYLLGKTIKNSCLYGIFQEEDEFSEVRKYKIHSSVYEK